MNTSRQAARQRRQRRRLMLGGTSALIAAGVLVYLVMALVPDRNADAAPAAATPLASTQVKATAAAWRKGHPGRDGEPDRLAQPDRLPHPDGYRDHQVGATVTH